MNLIGHVQGKSIGQPVHPIVARFPAALLPASFLFELAAVVTGDDKFVLVAYYVMVAGVMGAFVAAPLGIIDYLYDVPKGTRAADVALAHGVLNAIATLIFAASVVLRQGSPGATSTALMLMSLVGALVLSASSLLGGLLIHQYGFRADYLKRNAARAVERVARRAA